MCTIYDFSLSVNKSMAWCKWPLKVNSKAKKQSIAYYKGFESWLIVVVIEL